MTNTIHSSPNDWCRLVLVLFAALLCAASVTRAQESDTTAQTNPEREYTVESSLSAGPAISLFRYRRTRISPEGTVAGASTMLRIMWHPGRLLSFGVAIGYTAFSFEDFTPFRGYLCDIVVPAKTLMYGFPLQVAVSMQKGGLDLGMGMGPYMMTVELFDDNAYTQSRRLELGLTIFASYEWDIGAGFRAGPAFRCIILAYRGIFTMIPEYRVRYDLFSY